MGISSCTITHIALSNFLLKCVGFWEGGKPEYPEKNPRALGEISYDSAHMRHGSRPRLGLTCFSVVGGNALTACATRASHGCVGKSRVSVLLKGVSVFARRCRTIGFLLTGMFTGWVRIYIAAVSRPY